MRHTTIRNRKSQRGAASLRHALCCVPAAVALASPTVRAQQVPTRTIAPLDVEYAEPFSQVRAIRELRDGRVIVSDPRERTLQLIDLRRGRATAIGREGRGPLEWGLPGGLLAVQGDTTLVVDTGNGRYLVVGPDGRAVRTFNPVADVAVAPRGDAGRGGHGGPILIGIMGNARASDAQGRLYYQGLDHEPGTGGGVAERDSVPIVRYTARTRAQDNVAWLRLAARSVSMRGGGGGANVLMGHGSARPFDSGDEWTVFSDGRIAVARVAGYRVEIIHPDGRRAAGPVVAYPPVRVTEADKEQWREQERAANLGVRATAGEHGGNIQRSVGRVPVQEPAEWPATKSPFLGNSVWAAPSGETWVVRTRAAADRVPTADVFNARGRLIARVVLPAATQLVGFGARHVYLVRTDDYGLQYLRRYALP